MDHLQTSRRTSACTGTAGAGATRPPTSRPAGTRTGAASASAPSSTASATRATATPTAKVTPRRFPLASLSLSSHAAAMHGRSLVTVFLTAPRDADTFLGVPCRVCGSSGWAGEVCAEQRRVLVGDERAADLLRLLGMPQHLRPLSSPICYLIFSGNGRSLTPRSPAIEGDRAVRVPVPAGVPWRRPQM